MTENIGSTLLGTIISNADAGAVFPDGITATMFVSSKDRVIFSTASEMIREGIPPNLVLLASRLEQKGKLAEAGEAVYLAELTTLHGTSFPSQIERYGQLLKQQARNREIARAIKEAAEGLKNESPELIVPELLWTLAEYSNGNERQAFKLTRLDSIEVKPASWIVNGLIENGSFCSLYGDSGAGKSFLAIELAACIATGTPFHGIPVKQGPVIYLAGEGHSGLARRFKAWSIARGISLEGVPLYLSAGAMALIEPTVMGPVCNALEKLIKEIGNPSLVILDTWSRVLGGDDSAPSDAAAGVAALDGLRARYGNFAAMVVHHEGHQKGRGRGWSGLRAAVDMEYRAERGTDGILRLECTKAKDTHGMEPMAFHFMGVELPMRNESGEPVTSAVLNQVEWEPAPGTSKEPAVGRNQTLALDILNRLSADGSVSVEAWREACKAEGIIKQRFYDVKKTLIESRIVEINNSFVRLVRNGNAVTPLLYKGVLRTVTDIADKVTDSYETLPTVTVTQKPLPPDIPPEYKERYDYAFSEFLNKGCSPEDAVREAREFALLASRAGA
jgi:hypothetical protein